MGLLFFFIGITLGVSFLCSMLEAMLLSLQYSHIQIISQTHPKAGRELKKIKDKLDVSIASILTLNTFAHTIGAAGIGAQSAKLFGNEWMFVISAVLTIGILYLSEIIPKTLGAIYFKELAPRMMYILVFLNIMVKPLVFLSQKMTSFIRGKKEIGTITREEIIAQTSLGEDAGVIEEQESDFIENILSMNKRKIEDILTPRSVVFSLEADTKISEAVEIADINRFSRLPIYEGDKENVIGYLLAKEIYRCAFDDICSTQGKNSTLRKLVKSLYEINENIPVIKAFNLFIRRKEHMFLVRDGYGQNSGIVTLEDCIETLLGLEIVDESDNVADMQQLAKIKMKQNRDLKFQKI